jgi:hypothetical protein
MSAPLGLPTPVPNRALREIVREEPVMRAQILAFLTAGPRTIPEIASELGCPTHEVVFWVMGMRRYGYLAEVKGATDEGYFRYEAIVRASAPAPKTKADPKAASAAADAGPQVPS